MATQPPILSKSGKKWAEKYVLLFLTFQGVAWTQIQFFVVLTWFHKKIFPSQIPEKYFNDNAEFVLHFAEFVSLIGREP